MSGGGVRWKSGERAVQRRVEAWLEDRGEEPEAPLHQSDRRSVHRLGPSAPDPHGVPPHPTTLAIKRHRTRTGPHRLREAWKQWLGRSPAMREWRALVELHAAGVPVPRPLALGLTAEGDPLVVTAHTGDGDLASVLDEVDATEAATWIERVAAAVSALHAAGYRHGDLHLGNLRVTDAEVWILDLQSARRTRSERLRLRDLAHLDFSLARRGLPLELRRVLRRGEADPARLDAAARRFVRDFARGRARRELRPGRAWRRIGHGSRRGLREATAPEEALEAALAAASSGRDGERRRRGRTRIWAHAEGSRDWVVKRTRPASAAAALGDALRGSAARRSFFRGQRLALLGELAARPVAALDERRWGLARTSWLVLERVGELDLDAWRPDDAESARRCAVALAEWIAEWQAWGIEHRDLKAGNVRISNGEEGWRFWLVDLEDLRFRRRPSSRARLRALVQLNASLADEAFPVEARLEALEAYLSRLPITGRNAHDLAPELVRRSVARGHRFRGEGCSGAASAGGGPTQSAQTVSHSK